MKITITAWTGEGPDSQLIEADTLREALTLIETHLKPHFKPISYKCDNCSKESKTLIEAKIEGKKLYFCSHECIDRFEAILKQHKESVITKDDELNFNSENSKAYAPAHLSGD